MGRLAGFSSICCVVALLAQRAARIPSRPAAYSPKYLKRLDDLRKETAHVDETLHRHTYLVIGGTGFTSDGSEASHMYTADDNSPVRFKRGECDDHPCRCQKRDCRLAD